MGKKESRSRTTSISRREKVLTSITEKKRDLLGTLPYWTREDAKLQGEVVRIPDRRGSRRSFSQKEPKVRLFERSTGRRQ